MKLYKVKVNISQSVGGGTSYTYPQAYWDSHLRPLVYESENSYATVKARKTLGNFTEFILCLCEDETKFVPHPDFTEVSMLEADALGKLWSKSINQNGIVKQFDINEHI